MPHGNNLSLRVNVGGGLVVVQVFVDGPGDVSDNDDGVRLVVLAPTVSHSNGDDRSTAIATAEKILNQRDTGPRLNRNLLVFVAGHIGDCSVPIRPDSLHTEHILQLFVSQ